MRPKVFGHRGASGYRPENTIEAFELAIDQGADGVECDLVPTRDGELIIRHENLLNGTTNIETTPQFYNRRRLGYSDGQMETGWFSEDFTLRELNELRATERLPLLRPGSARFNGQFKIPTIDELLANPSLSGRTLVIEVKHGMHFTRRGIDVAGILARKLANADYQERGIDVVIESFDAEMLKLLKQACGQDKKYVFLTELVRLPNRASRMSKDYMHKLREDFDGLSLDLPLLFDLDENGLPTVPNGVAQEARELGLSVYGWTLKAEDAKASVDEYFAKVAGGGLDGIFVDQPDLLRQVVDGTL